MARSKRQYGNYVCMIRRAPLSGKKRLGAMPAGPHWRTGWWGRGPAPLWKAGEAGRVFALGGLHGFMRTRLVTWKGWTGEGSSLSPTGPIGPVTNHPGRNYYMRY